MIERRRSWCTPTPLCAKRGKKTRCSANGIARGVRHQAAFPYVI
jgi:hypothetical protein